MMEMWWAGSESMQAELFAGTVAAATETPLPHVPTTVIGVQSLFMNAALVEIEAVAVFQPELGLA